MTTTPHDDYSQPAIFPLIQAGRHSQIFPENAQSIFRSNLSVAIYICTVRAGVNGVKKAIKGCQSVLWGNSSIAVKITIAVEKAFLEKPHTITT